MTNFYFPSKNFTFAIKINLTLHFLRKYDSIFQNSGKKYPCCGCC